VKAKKPSGLCKYGKKEVYRNGRFLTVTGHRVDGSPLGIEERQAETDALHAALVAEKNNNTKPKAPKKNTAKKKAAVLDDQELLETAFDAKNGDKIKRLYDGDISDYPSASEADAAFIFHCAFYTKDPIQIDRLFRSSKLMRPKWEGMHHQGGTQSYGDKIIEDAIANVQSSYNPNYAPVTSSNPNALCTDSANGERLVKRFGDDIRYCYLSKSWHIWNGKFWAKDELGKIKLLAKKTARGIHLEAANTSGRDEEKQLGNWAVKSQDEYRKRAMIESAQSEPGVAIRPSDLDVDPYLFNMENGTLDLRTGKCLSHDRKHLISKISNVQYDPMAQCPRWMKFIYEICDGDQDLVLFIQSSVGIKAYSTFAPTTAGNCIMLIVWPSFRFVRSVTLPDLLLDFVFLKIGSNLASATMNLPAFSAFPFSVFV
jgi:putative DNA primase/helicase